MSSIILTTINAKYLHASLGLRYLYANLGDLQPHARILEHTLDDRPEDIVERLLAHQPRIIGVGVYIWNARLSTDRVDFDAMQAMNRFARYWDLIANSGRFESTRPLLLGDRPFDNFHTLSDWLYRATGQTHRIALHRLFALVRRGAVEALGLSPARVDGMLERDEQRLRRANRRRKREAGPRTPHRERQTRHAHANQEYHHEH